MTTEYVDLAPEQLATYEEHERECCLDCGRPLTSDEEEQGELCDACVHAMHEAYVSWQEDGNR